MFQFDAPLSGNIRIANSVNSAASNCHVSQQNFQENRRFNLRTAGFQGGCGFFATSNASGPVKDRKKGENAISD